MFRKSVPRSLSVSLAVAIDALTEFFDPDTDAVLLRSERF
jgi:hypothetical protein